MSEGYYNYGEIYSFLLSRIRKGFFFTLISGITPILFIYRHRRMRQLSNLPRLLSLIGLQSRRRSIRASIRHGYGKLGINLLTKKREDTEAAELKPGKDIAAWFS